jgi:hypothetical protein
MLVLTKMLDCGFYYWNRPAHWTYRPALSDQGPVQVCRGVLCPEDFRDRLGHSSAHDRVHRFEVLDWPDRDAFLGPLCQARRRSHPL